MTMGRLQWVGMLKGDSNMKASDLFVKALENEGVEYIFAVPGEENLDLIESIRQSTITLIINRHEQGAGFMAATYGRLTQKTGVCLSTLGPGATNLVTAAAYAQLGAMPMFMITGQKPIKTSKQGKFQIIDVVDMMRPITQFSKQIVNGHTIPALVREAFRISMEERPGAVHLELPEDIAREDVDADLFTIHAMPRPTADAQMIQDAVDLIHAAKMPLLLIGAGANRKETSKALKAFIEKMDIPFFNTQMGKGVVDERHPLFMGTAALSEGDYLHCAIARADLIINVGHDIIEKPPFIMHHGGPKVIHINFFSAHIDDVYFPDMEVIGDIANTICRMTELMSPNKGWDFRYYQRVKEEIEKNIHEGCSDPRFPMHPPRLVSEVRKVMPEDGILALDNGMYKIWFARNYLAYRPNTILLDNALASMGAGLPSGMAAKLVYPDRKVVCVCGDGGFMMNSHELETAIRLKLDLVILILRDNAYGMIKWKQDSMGFKDFGLDFGNPDFVAFANSFGATGHAVTQADEFAGIFQACLDSKGVHVIDVPIDYSDNVKLLVTQLKEKTCLI